jgi:glycogen debranching enzyme
VNSSVSRESFPGPVVSPDLPERAQAVLDGNWRGGYTVPSARLYPFQWSWDSGFIALGQALYRPERAIEEIRSMFKGQWKNGLLPHMNFHQVDPAYFPGPEMWGPQAMADRPPDLLTSGITQPPVFGFVVGRIAGLPFGQTAAWREFEREIYPKLLALHRYLYTQRDPQQEGLVYIQHNWEAGTDNSPTWDAILDAIEIKDGHDYSARRRDLQGAEAAQRPTNANYQRYIYLVDLFIRCGYRDAAIAAECPFLVQDVLFNSLLVKSNTALISLARRLGEATAELEAWNAKTTAAINQKLWDPATGFYYAYDLRNQRRIPIKTSSGFMPLFAGISDAAQAASLAGHLERSFTRGPGWRLCASTAVDEPAFDPVKYWRGPVWINLNWMLHHGLRRAGFADLAQRVKADTLALLETVGFSEYFDARPAADGGTAAGLGAERLSWSAALALDLLNNPAEL